jgi:hypothetical protein
VNKKCDILPALGWLWLEGIERPAKAGLILTQIGEKIL